MTQLFGVHDVNTEVSYKGTRFVVASVAEQRVELLNPEDGERTVHTDAELVASFHCGDLCFESIKLREPVGATAAIEEDEKVRAVVEIRLKAIQPILDIPKHLRRKKDWDECATAARSAWAQVGRSKFTVRTLRRWVRCFELEGRPGLVTRYHGSGPHRELAERLEIVLRHFAAHYQSPQRPTFASTAELIVKDIAKANVGRRPEDWIKVPELNALIQQLRRLDNAHARTVLAARHGERAAQRAYDDRGSTPRATRPLQRVQIDHTPADILVVDEVTRQKLGSPWLTLVSDEASGYPLAVTLDLAHPSYELVMNALLIAILPKIGLKEQIPGLQHDWISFGVPETYTTDGGKEFRSDSFKDACFSLSIRHDLCPPRAPQFKGHIEARLKHVQSMIHELPGSRSASGSGNHPPDSIPDGEISLSALRQMLYIWSLDDYAEQPQPSLGGLSPRASWERLTAQYPVRKAPSAQKLRILLGRMDKAHITEGIKWNNLRYHSKRLSELGARLRRRDNRDGHYTSEPVKFKYDPYDLSEIYVYDRFAKEYITVPGVDWRRRSIPRGFTIWNLDADNRKRKLQEAETRKTGEPSAAHAASTISHLVEQERRATRAARKHQRRPELVAVVAPPASEGGKPALPDRPASAVTPQHGADTFDAAVTAPATDVAAALNSNDHLSLSGFSLAEVD